LDLTFCNPMYFVHAATINEASEAVQMQQMQIVTVTVLPMDKLFW